MSKMNFIMKHGNNEMLKGLINSGEFNDAETFRDHKHKTVLSKLLYSNDPEYAHYRDKRMDAKIDSVDNLGKENKQRMALAISTDDHIAHDHLHWVVANGTPAAIANVLLNKHSTHKHFHQAHGVAVANPEMAPTVLRHLRNNPRTPNDLKEKIGHQVYEPKNTGEMSHE